MEDGEKWFICDLTFTQETLSCNTYIYFLLKPVERLSAFCLSDFFLGHKTCIHGDYWELVFSTSHLEI